MPATVLMPLKYFGVRIPATIASTSLSTLLKAHLGLGIVSSTPFWVVPSHESHGVARSSATGPRAVVAGSLSTEWVGGGLSEVPHRESPPVHYARPSCRRASFVPATRRLSFSKATQRGTAKKPQSGTAERRATGMYFAQSASRSATSSGVSM